MEQSMSRSRGVDGEAKSFASLPRRGADCQAASAGTTSMGIGR